MTYILSAQRNLDDAADADRLWKQYARYVRDNEAVFPPGAFELATSDWYYSFTDHRTPHDSWLEWVKFEEPASGARHEERKLSLRVRLLGAYHDNYLEFHYPIVYSYSMENMASGTGHGDWQYDEFRLSPEGHLLHEIEWAGARGSDGSRWLIEASDVLFTSYERSA